MSFWYWKPRKEMTFRVGLEGLVPMWKRQRLAI